MAEVFASSEDPDQMQHYVVSDLGLHCLSVPFKGSPDNNWLINVCGQRRSRTVCTFVCFNLNLL